MNIEFTDSGYCSTKECEEFVVKKCEKGLPRSLWETYSAFANTFGGTIAFGIDESNGMKVVGVEDPDKIIQDFWGIINNTQKVSCNLLTSDDVEVRDVNGKTVILIHVPRAERRRRPIYINDHIENGTYRRNGDGDYHCPLSEI